MEVPAAHLLIDNDSLVTNSTLPTIDDALEVYLRTKGANRSKLFFSHATRTISYLKDCLGSRALDQYTSADAAQLRDWLIGRGLSSASVQRNFSSIRAVVNFVIQEHGLDCRNPFSGVYLPTDAVKQKRRPIAIQDICRLQAACQSMDDDLRHLVGMISDTGMRLAEAVGLKVSDINVRCEYPHVLIKPHPHRRLKTASSERVVPLVGASLWAAERLINQAESAYCFSRYASNDKCNSNSASSAINKWIKTVVGSDAVIHGLRHSFRDRLRATEAPTEVIDQLGGWSLKTVGQGYGDGYQLDLLSNWMQKIAVDHQLSTLPV
jgi:integrase